MSVARHLPVLIIILPLSFALLGPFLSKLQKQLGKICVTASLAAALLCAIGLFVRVMHSEDQNIHYWMGHYRPPFGIEFYIDPLNALLVIFILMLALCTAFYSSSFMKNKTWLQLGGFYSVLSLLVVGLCGMCLTGDVFNLYVFLELSSLSCYGLIAFGGRHATMAAFRYLLIGTIGASFYLIAIGCLYAMTGSLNMQDMSVLLQEQARSPLLLMACACLIAAFGIKMAIFPFHVWQPDAYSSAHPGVSPLISGAMSKVPAFALLRFFFFIFGINHEITLDVMEILGAFGAIGMIYGSVMAIRQTDFRRMLAYSSVAQLGYVALGLGMADLYGIGGVYLHMLNHMLMKGGLFFVIGAIQYRFGIVDIRQMGQLHKKMPVTCFTLVMCALGMIGIPPTGGFFSKWDLIMGAMDQKLYLHIAVLVASSLLNAIYFIRVLENIFISPAVNAVEKKEKTSRFELPLTMLIPIVLFGIGVLAMGFFNGRILYDMIKPILQGRVLL